MDISTDWRNLRLRPTTRQFIERLTDVKFIPSVKYIILFGSEARGVANVKSDVDLSVVSEQPLALAEMA